MEDHPHFFVTYTLKDRGNGHKIFNSFQEDLSLSSLDTRRNIVIFLRWIAPH